MLLYDLSKTQMKPRCLICEEDFRDEVSFAEHMKQHKVAELMAEGDSDFIPELPPPEEDPVTGQLKPQRKIFRQSPHSPLTEYGG